ncbi:MAG: phosphate signaling complex protein PhoU [Actinomycetota bacterium]
MRHAFTSELDQLKIQVELMGLRVEEAIKHATNVLLTGDVDVAEEVIAGDDDIDSMLVSVTERCYELLGRQGPVASDLRLIVSILRIVSDLERAGDLCLRIAKLAPKQYCIAANEETFMLLKNMAYEAMELFRNAVRSWATQDLGLARSLEQRDDSMDSHNERLMEAILRLQGPDAVPIAVNTLLAGRALERIADHSVMIGERIRYLLTGDVESISKEIGP